MILNEIVDLLMKSNRIAVTFHESPDGDSLGSSLALVNALRSINKDIYIISKEQIPETFSFLPLSNEIDGNCTKFKENTDCFVALDCGNIARLNANIDWDNKKFTVINIDHHLSNDKFGDFNLVDTKAAAVSEIIYRIIKLLNINIDTKIATCLYTSLLTDTGSFRHSSTTSTTHAIAGALIDTKFDFSSIHRKIFDNKKYNMLKLEGLVINDMYLSENKKLCVMKVTSEMTNKAGILDFDSAEIVSVGLKIDSVEVAVLIKEKGKGVKASLRSKNYVDVRKIAEKFGGGGHIRAAGLSVDLTLQEAELAIVNEIEKELA